MLLTLTSWLRCLPSRLSNRRHLARRRLPATIEYLETRVLLAAQIVTPSPAFQTAGVGESFAFDALYTTDPLDETLTGLGLRLHFDSTQVQFDGLTDVLQTSLFLAPSVSNDTEDFDSDPVTDIFVSVAWTNFGGSWPGVGNLPATLYTANFTALAAGTATMNFSDSDTAGGFELDATSAEVTIGGAASLSIAALDAAQSEGDSGNTPFTFTVTRSGDTSGTTTVNFGVSGAAPADAADFGGSLPGGQLSFAAGEQSQTITIDVSGDSDVEPDEGFTVTLSNTSGTAQIDTATAAGTIINDDTATLSIDNVSQPESGTFTFTITSDTVASADITVVVNTAEIVGQAAAGSDYTSIVNQTATIAAGNTSTTVTVTVNDDAIVEDDQSFEVNLSDARIDGVTDSTRVVIVDGAGIGAIENDDTAMLTISDIMETETDSDFHSAGHSDAQRWRW
jgi:hypothetical protein